jgi:hypothetical protein
MTRTLLASPWLPLLYWAAAIIGITCVAHDVSLKQHLGYREFQTVVNASVPTPSPILNHPSASKPHLAQETISSVSKSPRFWYVRVALLQKPDPSIQTSVTEVPANRAPVSTELQTSVSAPITTLAIRVDPLEQTKAETLEIQCRTSLPIRIAHGRSVTIHGVVTQEVVSSSGKILIMAGSRVVGFALLDPENERFRSDGLWSIFFDDTELKVQAQLLDRPAGLPGMLGQEPSNEDEAGPRPAGQRDGQFIFVPRNAPFALELHGEILLRDSKSNQTND